MGGKKQDKAERLNGILEAAEQAFRERGYEAATMDDVARLAKISRGLIYAYFPDKHALLGAVSKRMYEPVMSFCDAADAKSDALDALHGFMTDYLTYWRQHPQHVQFRLLHRIHLYENEHWRAVAIGEWAGLFRWAHVTLWRGEKSGVFRKHDKAAWATTLILAIEGSVVPVAVLHCTTVRKAVATIEQTVIQELIRS